MVSYDIRRLTAALKSLAHQPAALEIAQRWLEEMPAGPQREKLQGAVDQALQL